MKKLFTLAAAVLASFSLAWADYAPTAVYTVGDAATLGAQWKTGLNNKANYFEAGDTVIFSPFVLYQSAAADWQEWTGCAGSGSTGTSWSAKGVFLGNTGWFTSSAKAATVRSTRQYFYNVTNCTAVQVLVKSGSSSVIKLAAYEMVAGVPSETPAKSNTYNTGSDGILEITGLDASKTYRIVLNTDKDSNSTYYEIAFVHPHPCTDPEFTVPEGGNGFVGDPIDLAITSKNNSNPVNYAVTVDGVEGEYGTDYTFNVSPGLVQATPLKAGKFEITFSQASDGTYCDAEESATFVISEKSPVTSFEIDAPATAHIGEEVTIELKNFDAAPTTIVWYDGDLNEITAANGKTSYTFTPAAAGDYAFQVTAWNAYNALNEEAFNYTIITVAVGTDATLSDLKVNGATIDGFAADKFEYTIAAELGVYEALKVEATAADAPYASAAVVDNGEGKVTITVTAQNESTKEYVVNYNRAEATPLAPISTSTTWDWTKAGDVQTSALSETTTPKQSDEINFADVLTNYDASFNAAALVGKVQWYNRQESTNLYTQGNYWKFNTSVPGKLVITYSGTNTTARELRVNEVKVGEYNSNKPQTSGEINITAGEVTIAAYQGEAASMARIYKLVFTADGATAIDNTEAAVKAVKMVENGMLIIKKDGKKYNIIGSVIR